MIIIQAAGGLGNQNQQYVLYRKFVRLGKEARLDLSWFSDENQKGHVYKRVFCLRKILQRYFV